MSFILVAAQLLKYFIDTVIVTIIVALAVIAGYRRYVRLRMNALGQARISIPPVPNLRASRPGGLRLAEIPGDADLMQKEGVRLALETEQCLRRKITMAYGSAMGFSALILSCVQFYAHGTEFSTRNVVALAGAYGSALFPMLWITLALSAGRVFIAWLLYLTVVAAAVGVLAIIKGIFGSGVDFSKAGTTTLMVFALSGWVLWKPVLAMLATGWRGWRGVAPIVFSGLLLFGLAPFAGMHLTNFLSQTNTGERFVLQTVRLGIGLHGVFLALSLPAAYFAWRRIQSLTLAFEHKQFSDTQLLIRGWWLMFILLFALLNVGVVGKPLIVIAGSTVAYWGFLKLAALLLKFSRLNEARPSPKSLLLLRVFGFRKRTERLFDRLIERWRLFGSIHMIAGVDLAGRTIDPGDFLRFMTGRLNDYFVKGPLDLAQKLDALDRVPDPDGRYRVTEFFCHENTWQAALVGLLERSDIVLMDLRGFSEERKGCEFELEQIAARLPMEHFIVIVDSKTDLALFERSLAGASGVCRFIRVEKQTSKDIDRLLLALLDTGESAPDRTDEFAERIQEG